MKVTFIIRDKTDAFIRGNSDRYPAGTVMHVTGLNELPTNTARFTHLQNCDIGVKMKVGSCNAFRDRVELNQLLRAQIEPTYTLSPRKGYQLATFEFNPHP